MVPSRESPGARRGLDLKPRQGSGALGLLLVGALLLGCASTPKEGRLRGKVVSIADGDTLTVLEGRTTHKIRLSGIDAPERRQPFSRRSTEHLASFVFQREVEVEWEKRDRWGRILGKVLATDPACTGRTCPFVDVNLRQVEGGFAWWYRQYAREQTPEDRARYEAAEEASRKARRGLWADPAPTPPWEWRRERRKGSRSKKTTAGASAAGEAMQGSP